MPTVLIDIDALRKDHLGLYGYNYDVSPNLSRLASDSAVFESFYADDSPSMPSRATIISGRTSLSHRVTSHHADDQIMDSPYTWDLERKKEWEGDVSKWWNLPELLSFKGIDTCLVSSFIRKPAPWFNRTWDTVKQLNEPKTLTEVGASQVTDRAIDYLRDAPDEFFLYVQYWDPHAPLPEKGLRAESPDISQDDLEEHLERNGWASAKDRGIRSLEDIQDLHSRYNRAIRDVDRGIGRIMAQLQRKGIYDETNVIVTADHGESLGEKGVYQEHWSVREEVQNIPLILKTGKKGRFNGLCSTRDIAPTIADLHNIEKPDRWEGSSLLERMEKDEWEDSLLLHHGLYTVQRALVGEGWKLVRTLHSGFWDQPEYQLFNLDNGEERDLKDSFPEVTKRMKDEMESMIPEDDPYVKLADKGPAGYEYNKDF